MWKIGVIGTGYWSEKHIKAWQFISDAEITGFCDRNKGLLFEKAAQFHIPTEYCYTSLEEMLSEADIDVVDIITPPETHLELVRLAATAGKHIMCQKPFARSVEEAEQMVSIAEAAGVRLMVTENWRWLEPFQIIKKLLAENIVGNMNVIRYTHTDFYSPRFAPEKSCRSHFSEICPSSCFMKWEFIGWILGVSYSVNLSVYMRKPSGSAHTHRRRHGHYYVRL